MKKKIGLCMFAFSIVYILFTIGTTRGSIRFQIMLHSNPIAAYTTGLTKVMSKDGWEYYEPTTSIETETGSLLWFRVQQRFIFTYGEYYGWG